MLKVIDDPEMTDKHQPFSVFKVKHGHIDVHFRDLRNDFGVVESFNSERKGPLCTVHRKYKLHAFELNYMQLR